MPRKWVLFIFFLITLFFSALCCHAAVDLESLPNAAQLYGNGAATQQGEVSRFEASPSVVGESRYEKLQRLMAPVWDEHEFNKADPVANDKKIASRAEMAKMRGDKSSIRPSTVVGVKGAITAQGLDVRYRSLAGTPRQIKIKEADTKAGKSSALQKAVSGMAPGKERDLKTSEAFLKEHAGILRLDNPREELEFKRYNVDGLGRRHVRFQQKYKGIPAWPAELNVHLNADGDVDLMNGAYVATPKRFVKNPTVTSEQAEKIARSAVPDGGVDTTNVQKELIIYAPGDRASRLAWKAKVSVDVAHDWVVVVDALNGKTLLSYNDVKSGAVSGSGQDLTGVTRSLNVWSENSKYYMIDTSKPMYKTSSNPPEMDQVDGGIFVLDMNHTELPSSGGSFNSSYVTSTNTASGWLADAVSLSYNLGKTYDYFKNRHGWDSIGGNGGNVVGFVRVGTNFNNAFWTTSYNAVFFGDAKPYAAALDIVAHELTHGVTSYTCNLTYADQSGALNEAFSDIFGEMVEEYATGSTDWINGTVFQEATSRNMQNPSAVKIIAGYQYNYPSKMSEYYSRGGELLQMLQNEDYGGVHINMTIITHAFYMLAAGLDGAIGTTKAAAIFHRAQTVHLVANSQFIDMRLAGIQAAEELYGVNSTEAVKVGEAFDAVEITDTDSGTAPGPEPTTPVSGDDSLMFTFLTYDWYYSDYYNYLGRYETATGEYRPLSYYPVKRARPSVSGDGTLGFFVDYWNDACMIDTAGFSEEQCLGYSNQIHAVAMSPGGELYGFVMLDAYGDPTNSIVVVDTRDGGSTREFTLAVPGSEGENVADVVYADTMDFTSDNRYLVYDAYNIIQLSDGTKIGTWSIYAIDLVTEQTIALIPPDLNYDIGYPAYSQTTNYRMAWDLYDPASGISTIVASNLITGESVAVGIVDGDYGVPGYNGDDTSIAYAPLDTWETGYTTTGYSVVSQPLAADALTPIGGTSKLMSDAEFGVVYRRGTFQTPAPDITVAPGSLSFGSVTLGATQSKSITVTNDGSADLRIGGMVLTGTDSSQFMLVGGCSGQTLPASGACAVHVLFTPTLAGVKNANLLIDSDDLDEATVSVVLTGTAVTPIGDRDGDGVPDGEDAFPDNKNEWLDTDHDGIGDNADTDDDGDGYSDAEELNAGTDPKDATDHPGSSSGAIHAALPAIELLLTD